ncbi:MAG TPA: hypothetical protein ENN25_00695 [Euryarchaeota archaeon]|nr:hypothetical protein [Euryarchaeota archaeon]
MNNSGRSVGTGIAAGFVIIAIAVAMLVAWAIDDWILFIPILILECGVFGIFLSIIHEKDEGKIQLQISNKAFVGIWGLILSLIGVLWLLNDAFPGNFPILFAVFLIFIGVLGITLSLMRRS